jgi:hypothetical protein
MRHFFRGAVASRNVLHVPMKRRASPVIKLGKGRPVAFLHSPVEFLVAQWHPAVTLYCFSEIKSSKLMLFFWGVLVPLLPRRGSIITATDS